MTVPGVGTLAFETADIAISIGFGLLAGLAAGFLIAAIAIHRPVRQDVVAYLDLLGWHCRTESTSSVSATK